MKKEELKKILLVDDDADLRDMYTLILSKAGFEVKTANDGVQGLSLARQGGFNLILLDLMMPNMDGLGFLRAYREEKPKKVNGPIIVLSNAGYDDVANEVKALGGSGFLMKAELLPKDLVKAVEEKIK